MNTKVTLKVILREPNQKTNKMEYYLLAFSISYIAFALIIIYVAQKKLDKEVRTDINEHHEEID
jgi:cytochrome bd-type quinol oxidase subunit 1